MALVIDDLLVGLALDKAFDGALGARKFVCSAPRERLLWLLHKDFGKRTSLGKDEFYAWATDSKLIAIIDGLVNGTTQPSEEALAKLSELIRARLHRTPEDEREAMAAEIATATMRGYPLALREFPQYGQTLIRKVDAEADKTSEILAIVKRLDAEEPEPDLAGMLVAGPLAAINRDADAQRLSELEEAGQEAQAAALAEDLAMALADSGVPALAENYLTRAAALHERAGNTDEAARLLESVAWMRCDRRTHEASMTAHELERLLGDTPLVRGIKACSDWPELAQATGWLREAIAADEDPGRRLRFAAALAEIEAITGEPQTVIDDSAAISETDLEPGPRLLVELERVVAIEAIDGQDAAEIAWQRIITWAETAGDADSAGRVWARRGLQLTRRGDVEGAEAAYRQAMEAWANVPGAEELVAEAFFSRQAVSLSLGLWRGQDFELRSIAASLRSASPSGAQIGRRLQRNAADARIRKSFPDALRDNWLAVAAYRQIGSHQGLIEVAQQLAELFEATGRLPAAIAMHMTAGRGKEAEALVSRVDPQGVAAVLQADGAPWERAAAYLVLAALGPDAPLDVVDLLADDLMADSDLAAEGQIELVAHNASRALAEVSLQIPERHRQLAYERLAVLVRRVGWLDASRAAVRALMRDTDLGRHDATDLLGEVFFEDRPRNDVDARWLGERLAEHPALRDRVLTAARKGNEEAQAVLVFAGHDGSDDERLSGAAEDLVNTYTNAITCEIDGDQVTHHIGISFESGGMFCHWVSPEIREHFVARMLDISADDRDSESTRSSALSALFNAARDLTDEQRTRTLETIRRLAHGDYQPIEHERDQTDPLSRFQLRMKVEGSLHAAALVLAGQLAALGTVADWLGAAIEGGLASPVDRVQRGALDALGRAEMVAGPDDLRAWVDNPDPYAGREALMAFRDRNQQAVSDELPELVVHLSRPVRQLVIAIAGEEGRVDVLERAIAEEPNALLRATAQKHLVRIDVPDCAAVADGSEGQGGAEH